MLAGTLKKVQKGRLLSQRGVIRMQLRDYFLPNGYLVKLGGEEIKFSGDMNYTSMAAGVAVPFAGLGFKGKQVNCQPGMKFKYKLVHDAVCGALLSNGDLIEKAKNLHYRSNCGEGFFCWAKLFAAGIFIFSS